MVSGWARTTFGSLSNRDYRILWAGSTLAFLAFMMSSVVQSVVAFDLTGTNEAVGAVSLGMGLATLLIAPFGGVLADRLSKRLLLLVGQATIGFTFAMVGVLIVTGHITILLLAISTFIMGAVFSFIAPARQAWIGEILPLENLANGIALQQVAMTATRIFGPFIAGGLIAIGFVGTGGTYLVMSGMFILVLATLYQVPAAPKRATARDSSIGGDLLLGLGHLLDRPQLLVLASSFIGIVIAGFSYQVVLPGYLDHSLGRDPADIALMFGVGAVAGLTATIGLASISDSRHAFGIMLFGGLVMAIGLVFMAAAPGIILALGAMLLVGAGSSSFQLLNNSLIMQESDPEFHGRVMSLVMLAWGFNGLVAFPYGFLADRVGERETLFLMGMLVFAVTVASTVARAAASRRAAPARPALVEAVAGE
jgi:MFS family permease